ncbi:envelope stress response membrane protein PspB [Sphingomonas sp.]|uniref:envelope stress response membrane protein PspB n=1 Tax=Sphingomonas sp. TaxID=28214 RepID=UPI003B3A91FA
MEDILIPIVVIPTIFIGLPWLIFHYITQWKKSGTLSLEDENLLDELHELARRLDDRMSTIERIVAADNPDFRPRVAQRAPDPDEDRFDFDRSPERDTQPRRRSY